MGKLMVFEGYGGVQETDLLNELPSHTDHSVTWGAGWIPNYCYNEAITKSVSPSDFEVRNVYYTDCSAAWAFCRHKSARTSWEFIIDVCELFLSSSFNCSRMWLTGHDLVVNGTDMA